MGVRKLRLDIKVSGLVHIGNGQQYGKRDYFVKGGKIAILDVRRFTSQLAPAQISRYCEFLENANDRFGLQGFLGKKENADLLKVAQSSVAYQVDSPIATARRGSIQYHDVWQFVKDPYGNPYVPGSSVKGMLRTALLLNLVLDDVNLRASVDMGALANPKIACSSSADKQLDKAAFFLEQPNLSDPSIVNDVMKYVSVSDSEPLSVGDLVFAKKYDKFSKGDSADHKLDMGKLTLKEGNELDVYRECLRPGTVVSVDVVIDERIDMYFSSIVLDSRGLERILQRSFDFYSERFLSHFDNAAGEEPGQIPSDGRCHYIIASGPLVGMRCRNAAVDGTGFCNKHQDQACQNALSAGTFCYLGGGVDFMSKTITNALFDKEEDAVRAISHVLYSQFKTEIDRSAHRALWDSVQYAGFAPKSFVARRTKPGGRITKAKNDHRHWLDEEIGVSPHTMKWGIVGRDRYPMGKCSILIRES